MKRVISRYLPLVATTLMGLGLVAPAKAQVNHTELEQMGLKLQWEGQIEQSSKTDALPRLAVWAHTKERQQHVTVLFNGRSEHFSSDLVDREKYEKATSMVSVEKGNKKSDSKSAPSAEVPRIGLEGARKLAEETETRLELIARRSHRPQDGTLVVLIGKEASVDAVDARTKKILWSKKRSEIVFGTGRMRTMDVDGKKYRVIAERVEVDRANNYLVSASPEGLVQAFDAETGSVLWTTEVGSSQLETLAPGVDDEFVMIVNGQELFWLSLKDGRVLSQRHCELPGAGGVIAVRNWAYIPGLNGRLMGYNYLAPTDLPWSVRSNGTSHSPPVLSADGRFLAWNCEPKFLFIVRVDDRKPRQWSRFETSDKLNTGAAPCSRGFVVASAGGSVACIGTPTEKYPDVRGNAIVWRFSTGRGINRAPVAGHGLVVFTTSTEELIALDEEKGTAVWGDYIDGITEPVSVTPTAIYARSIDQKLVKIDRSSGKILGKTSFRIPMPTPNSINDRMYFVNERGMVMCLRETGADNPLPTYTPALPSEDNKKKKDSKPADESSEEGDVFSGDAMGSDSGASEFDEVSDAGSSSDEDVFGDGF